jgi:hypothetical protein
VIPSVGRVVHYVSYGTPGGEHAMACRAAIVTEIGRNAHPAPPGTLVGLAVLNPTGMFFDPGVDPDEGQPDNAGGTNLCDGLDFPGGTWHWPARI